MKSKTDLEKLSCPIYINGRAIDYVDSAEHVGVLRSSILGNMPHIMNRISAHRRALAAIMNVGLAKNHWAKPSSSLHLERLYGASVLFSGTASLVLSTKEIGTLNRHYKDTLRRIQKLPSNTPDCVVYFLSGSLPAEAILHLRILSLLGMICRLGNFSILREIGKSALLSRPSNKHSWFIMVRSICFQYLLPDPLLLIQTPQTKETWKRVCKAKVVSFWENKLRGQATLLPSLKFFKPDFMSLNSPHSVWTLPETSYEVKKSVIVASMLSGKYTSDYHARHWSRKNPEGLCQLCLASRRGDPLVSTLDDVPLGTIDHLLLECPSLSQTRQNCINLWKHYTNQNPLLSEILRMNCNDVNIPNVQFLLDPACLPDVIKAIQEHGYGILAIVHYLTRTWCYSLHIQRTKYLKLYNII